MMSIAFMHKQGRVPSSPPQCTPSPLHTHTHVHPHTHVSRGASARVAVDPTDKVADKVLSLANALLDGGSASSAGLARAGAQLMAASACIGTESWTVKVVPGGGLGLVSGWEGSMLSSHPLEGSRVPDTASYSDPDLCPRHPPPRPQPLQVCRALANEVLRSVAEGKADADRRAALCLALGCVHRAKGGLALQVGLGGV